MSPEDYSHPASAHQPSPSLTLPELELADIFILFTNVRAALHDYRTGCQTPNLIEVKVLLAGAPTYRKPRMNHLRKVAEDKAREKLHLMRTEYRKLRSACEPMFATDVKLVQETLGMKNEGASRFRTNVEKWKADVEEVGKTLQMLDEQCARWLSPGGFQEDPSTSDWASLEDFLMIV